MSIFIIILLAVTLSMDAFSLALIYGTLNLNRNIENKISILVGIFHFIMPILGYKIGEILLEYLKVNTDILVGIIFIILGIEMILSISKEERIKVLTNIFSLIVFALTVSIDSFSVGISFGVTKTNILLSCIIFSIVSSLFTHLGLRLGKRINDKFGNITVLISSIILIFLGIKYLT